MIEQEGDSQMHSTPMKMLPGEGTVSVIQCQKGAEALLTPKSLNSVFNPLLKRKMRKAQARMPMSPVYCRSSGICGNT